MIEKVERWRVTHGRFYTEEFTSLVRAEERQDELRRIKIANKYYQTKRISLGNALRIAYNYSIPDIFFELYTDTKLIISHWQCSEKSGYMPLYINKDMTIRVFGDVGSWSGHYGNDVRFDDLERYVTETLKKKATL